jgi:predicted RNase H-like HicB family nuclease
MGFLFLLLGMGYRHQFMYIYPKGPDSGGKLFMGFLNFIITCIIVAEFTVVGLLGIKQSPIAAGLMFPLLIVTILFVIYIKQKHLSQPEYLPARRCIIIDLDNEEDGQFDDSFVYRAYTHPDLKTEKEVLPDNMTAAGSRDEGPSTNEVFQDEHPSLDDVDSQGESPSAAAGSRDEGPSTNEVFQDEHPSLDDVDSQGESPSAAAGSRDEGPSTNEDFQGEHPSLDDVDSQGESPYAAGVSRDEDPPTVVISNMDEHKSTFDDKYQLPNDNTDARDQDERDQDENMGYSV